MTSLADLPLDILARIYYKGLELGRIDYITSIKALLVGRKEMFDEWCDEVTSCDIDNEVYNCTLREFFKALNLRVDEAQYVTLEHYHWTGWITYKWSVSSHLF